MTFSILLNVERRGKNVKATYPHRGAESQAEHPVKRFPKNIPPENFLGGRRCMGGWVFLRTPPPLSKPGECTHKFGPRSQETKHEHVNKRAHSIII